MSERDRVTERRIDLSLPIVEGNEEMPDLTADILARLRAEGMLPRRSGRIWIAAAELVLGTGVALGVALRGPGEPEEVPAAGMGQETTGIPLPTRNGKPPLVDLVLPGAPVSRQDAAAVTKGSGGNSWFLATVLDLGTIYHHQQAVGTFRFQNPTRDTVLLSHLRQSCTCTKATFRIEGEEYYMEATGDGSPELYHVVHRNGIRNPERVTSIPVGPRATGSLEVKMEMAGIVGLRGASIGFQTTDPDLPVVNLRFEATGATYFSISPEEINLETMLWNERREFTATVTSPVLEDFDIVRMDPLPAGMEVSYGKTMREGRAEFTITGSYGPLGSDAASGGRIVFHTDYQDLSFALSVLAVVEGPLRVQPGSFLSLGRIRAAEGAERSVTLEPTDGFELQVEKLEARELSFDRRFLELSSEKKGKALEIAVRVLPGVRTGTVVRGDVIVHLNHPAAKTKTILFNGFVR